MSVPQGVILVAHGAVESPRSNQPLHHLAADVAQRMLQRGLTCAAVTPAFLAGEPQVSQVLESLTAGTWIVVPVMTSHGYYLKKLPTLFLENSNADQFQLLTTSVVGTHANLAKLMRQRADRLMQQHQFAAKDTTVLVIGHGTRRNPNSGKTTLALTDAIQQAWRSDRTTKGLVPSGANEANSANGVDPPQPSKPQFITAFLDQDPTLEHVVESIKTRNVVAMPFLISRGPHMTEDIPRALQLNSGPEIEFPLVGPVQSTPVQSIAPSPWEATSVKQVVCDGPLALYAEMPDLIVDLIEAVLAEASNTPTDSKFRHQGSIGAVS